MFSLRECNVPLFFSPGISIAEVRRAIDRPAINLDSFLRLHRCLAHCNSMSYTVPRRRRLFSLRLVANRPVISRSFLVRSKATRMESPSNCDTHYSVHSFTIRSSISGYEFTCAGIIARMIDDFQRALHRQIGNDSRELRRNDTPRFSNYPQ